jgi:cardiolipin synthase A/B
MPDSKKTASSDVDYPWWMTTLAAFGAVALVAGVITLFSSAGRRPGQLWSTHSAPVESAEFLASISGVTGGPLRTGGTAQFLRNGDQYFPSMLEAFRGAQKSINFSAYIWEKGQVSDQFLAVFVERARAGVEVRVLLDGMGGMKAPSMDELKAAGGKVVVFRPARFGKFTRLHKRNHRRAIVVDGTVAFTGGAAVADQWLGNAENEERWYDTMVRVTGPPALTLQSAFADLWAFACGEMLEGPQFFPPAVSDDAPGAMVHTGLASLPAGDLHPLRLFLAQSFLAARQRLYITTPYFVLDEEMRNVVAQRARAGVDVRILLPDEHTDAKLIRLTSHHYFEDLLAAGVKVYEYQPTMMHSKCIVVDGKWSVVGSANMDIRSIELNVENVLGILDEGFGRTMEAAFEEDLKHSDQIHLEQWRRRGTWAKVKEWVASRLAEQY